MKIVILGCGRVGSLISKELHKCHSITVVDSSKERLDFFEQTPKPGIGNFKTKLSNITKESVPDLVKDSHLVVSAMPGHLGFGIAKSVLESKKHLVDISFFPEDAYLLKELANKNGLLAAFDCGIAPGFSNMILGHFEKNYDNVDKYLCCVGGLPFERTLPFQYKASFSPADVIEEYTRPARYIENGKIITKPALTDVEEVNFNEIGTLESFNSDGLRTMLNGRQCQNIKEKTMRFPGHVKIMRILRDGGFFDKETVKCQDSCGRPMEFVPFDTTSQVLFKKWQYRENEPDFTVMRTIVETHHDIHTIDLFDKFNEGESSMARTTGFTCTTVVKAFYEKLLEPKFYTPEEIGEVCFDFVQNELKRKGIKITWIQKNKGEK